MTTRYRRKSSDLVDLRPILDRFVALVHKAIALLDLIPSGWFKRILLLPVWIVAGFLLAISVLAICFGLK